MCLHDLVKPQDQPKSKNPIYERELTKLDVHPFVDVHQEEGRWNVLMIVAGLN
jgi:hypothetical protein